MPSNPLKPAKAKASHRAWHVKRPGRRPTRFSGIKSARSPEDTCATSYEFNSDRSTDGINPVQELTGSTPKANLLTGLGVDETFSRTDASGARHLLTDALGSTLALTDGTGAVQTRYSYEAYGKTTVSGTASSNSFEYTGRENDNTGLYFYRARYYNPGLQRFVSEDPIGLAGGPNVYAYVGGNPLTFTDPLGLMGNGPSGTNARYGGSGGESCVCRPSSSGPTLQQAGDILGGSGLGGAGLGAVAGAAYGAAAGVAEGAQLGALAGLAVADATFSGAVLGTVVGGALGLTVGGLVIGGMYMANSFNTGGMTSSRRGNPALTPSTINACP